MEEQKQVFDQEAYKCESFLEGLNRCKTPEEVRRYVDSIVDGFKPSENDPDTIGTGVFFSRDAYVNNGQYDGFINPQMKILNGTLGYAYHIYDREYLYLFAIGIRNMNLPNDTCLLPYVMKMLDSYFGFPKDSVDRREDYFYDFAVKHAEEFYKEHGIPIDENMGAVDQMQMRGDFPLSILRGVYEAQCMERAALAQNLMKMCGYNTSIMYGDCESRGHSEGHAWNVLYDKNGNVMIMDFSNTVFLYENGQFARRNPYSCKLSRESFLSQEGDLDLPDYHYEDGKLVRESTNRKYHIGKRVMYNDMEDGGKAK